MYYTMMRPAVKPVCIYKINMCQCEFQIVFLLQHSVQKITIIRTL